MQNLFDLESLNLACAIPGFSTIIWSLIASGWQGFSSRERERITLGLTAALILLASDLRKRRESDIRN